MGEDHDNEDWVMLPDNLFLNLLDLDLQRRILNTKTFDSGVGEVLGNLLQEGPSPLRTDLHDWRVENINGNKVVYYKDKTYIPQDIQLRRDILKMFHDHETAGHPGELETYNSIRQHYWWPGL